MVQSWSNVGSPSHYVSVGFGDSTPQIFALPNSTDSTLKKGSRLSPGPVGARLFSLGAGICLAVVVGLVENLSATIMKIQSDAGKR